MYQHIRYSKPVIERSSATTLFDRKFPNLWSMIAQLGVLLQLSPYTFTSEVVWRCCPTMQHCGAWMLVSPRFKPFISAAVTPLESLILYIGCLLLRAVLAVSKLAVYYAIKTFNFAGFTAPLAFRSYSMSLSTSQSSWHETTRPHSSKYTLDVSQRCCS